jgi:hypothetical protein
LGYIDTSGFKTALYGQDNLAITFTAERGDSVGIGAYIVYRSARCMLFDIPISSSSLRILARGA